MPAPKLSALTTAAFAATLLAQAPVATAATRGAVLFRGPQDDLISREATIDISSDWSRVTLKLGDDSLTAQAYRTNSNRDVVGLVFSHLPYDDSGRQLLILKGKLEPGKRYFGEAFTTTLPADGATAALAHAMRADDAENLSHKASFYFGTGPNINGVPIVRGRPLDSNNPCPHGPCWTDGGVGRHLEYYPGGPIQNPGHAYPPAGFNRGVPYEWTREGQLAAQWVGIERTNVLYNTQLNYGRYGWGWGFWLFPWAWW
jgi:hypothetical protein